MCEGDDRNLHTDGKTVLYKMYFNRPIGLIIVHYVNLNSLVKLPCIIHISGLKAFNHLPRHIKSLANDMKSFKTSLKRFLYHHSFYSIYYEYNDDKGM